MIFVAADAILLKMSLPMLVLFKMVPFPLCSFKYLDYLSVVMGSIAESEVDVCF